MLSRIIVNSYKIFIEISLWLSLLLFMIVTVGGTTSFLAYDDWLRISLNPATRNAAKLPPPGA